MNKRLSIPFKLNPLAAALRRIGVAGLVAPSLALAGPTGGEVVGGEADISSPDANTTTIDQSSDAAIINWDSFSIGGEEFVIFNQPSSSAVALNRVVGGTPSEIFGHLLATGRVFLVNPSGVLFAPGAELDVGGLVATTMNLSDEDFMAGRYTFTPGGDGSVVNEGRITAADGGFVVLSADYVRNSGAIAARLGEIVLASGSAMTLDLSGEGLVGFSIDRGTLADLAGVDNLGSLVADGGSVVMSAALARGLLGTVINNEGLVQARSIEEGADGAIYLSASGGGIAHSGTLDASGAAEGGRIRLEADGDILLADGSDTLADGGVRGGEIRALAGGRLHSARTAHIDVRGGSGRGGFVELSGRSGITIRGVQQIGAGGRLLIDPSTVTVGAQNGECLYDYCYELMERVLQQGADVQIVADSLITLLATAEGRFDGRAVEGVGGSLMIGIGSVDENGYYSRGMTGDIVFSGPSSDLFLMDGSIALYGGESGGDISNIVNLQAASITIDAFGDVSGQTLQSLSGSINLSGQHLSFGAIDSAGYFDAYVSGDFLGSSLMSGGSVYIDAGGSIHFTDTITAGLDPEGYAIEGANISLHAQGGDLDLANLELMGGMSSYNGISLYGFNAIDAGDILTDGGLYAGSDAGSIQLGNLQAAYADLWAAGDLWVGTLTTTALSNNEYQYYGLSAGSGGDIRFGDIDTQGAISIYSESGSLLTGSIRTESNDDEYYSADASIYLTAGNGIETGDISATSNSVDGYGYASLSIHAYNGDVQLGSLSTQSSSYGSIYVSGNGTLRVGDISSNGGVDLHAGAGIEAGQIQALEWLYAYSEGGGINAGDLSVSGSASPEQFYNAYLDLYAGSGDILVGDLGIDSEGGGAYLSVSAGNGHIATGNVALNAVGGDHGPVLVNTLRSAQSDYYEYEYGLSGATAYFSAGGDLDIHGTIDIHATAGTYSDGYGYSETAGEAYAWLYGQNVGIDGAVTISGVGDAGLDVYAGGTIDTGAVDIHASLATYEYNGDGYREFERYGDAYLSLYAEGALLTGPLNLAGPNAGAHLVGTSVKVNGSLELQAAASDSGNGAYWLETENEQILVESTAASAGAYIMATDGSIEIVDALRISGPMAGAQLTTDGDVSIGGDVDVTGTGYEISGDATRLLYSEELALGYAQLRLVPPLPFDGQVQWGGAGVQINGYDGSHAGAIDIGGALSVSGQGAAIAELWGDSLAIGGSASATATQGTIAGSWQEYRMIDGEAYVVTRTASGSDGESAARYGQAWLAFELDGGNASLGNLSATGGEAGISLNGGQAWTVGDVTVAGGLGAEANDYADSSVFSPASNQAELQAQAVAEQTATTLVGGTNVFVVGEEGRSPASLSAGDIDVSGTGQAVVGLFSSQADVGAISLQSATGLLQTNDPTVLPQPAELAPGDASLAIATDTALNASAIEITAARDVHIGGSANVSGIVRIDAGGRIDDVVPLTQFPESPLEDGAVAQFYGAGAADESFDLFLSPLILNAGGNVDLSFGESSSLSGLELSGAAISLGGAAALDVEGDITLAALGALSLGGSALSGSRLTLSGDSLSLGDSALGADTIAIHQFNGDLVFGDFEGSSLSLRTDNGNLSAGDIHAASFHADANGDLSLGDLTIGDSLTLLLADNPGSLLSTGDILFDGALNFASTQSSLSFGDIAAQSLSIALTQGDARFGSLTLDALQVSAANVSSLASSIEAAQITIDASGVIDLTGSTLDAAQVSLGADGLTLDGTQILANALSLRQFSGNLGFSGFEGGSLSLQADSGDLQAANIVASALSAEAGGSLSLGQATVSESLSLTAGDALSLSDVTASGQEAMQLQAGGHLSLTDSALSADSLALDAGGNVSASGDSSLSAGGLGVRAGGSIDLAAASLSVGSGSAPFGGDSGLINRLPASLRPESAAPNAAFIAQSVALGALGLSGDHLYIEADSVHFGGVIDAPIDLFVQFRPLSDGASLGIENAASAGRTINFSVADHVTVFPGTTLAFGGSDYAGDIFVGSDGELNLSERNTNFVFLTSGTINGSQRNLPTGGEVVVLGGTLVDVDDDLAAVVPPAPEGDQPPGQGGFVIDLIGEDEDDDLIDETSGGAAAECE